MPVNSVRRNGSYAPLSAHYYKDDAVDEAGLDAELLFVRGLAFCADVLSDGFISDRQLVRFVGVGMGDAVERAHRLVDVGLWEREENGYRIRSWLTWNRSREDITERQAKDAQRKAKGRADVPEPPPEPPDDTPDDSERSPNGVRAESGDVSAGSPDGVQPRAPAYARAPRHSTPQQEKTSATADAATTTDDAFADFWAAYPRKMKKQDAEKAWAQVLRRDVDPAHVIAQAVAQAARWATEGRQAQYIPYPASWLRGGSYDDEIDTGPRDIWTIPDDQLTDDDVDTLVGGSNMPPEPPDEFWTWPLEQRHDWNRANVRQWRAERREKAIRERARRLGRVTRLDDHRRDVG